MPFTIYAIFCFDTSMIPLLTVGFYSKISLRWLIMKHFEKPIGSLRKLVQGDFRFSCPFTYEVGYFDLNEV